MKKSTFKRVVSHILVTALCITAITAFPANINSFAAESDNSIIQPYNIAIITTSNAFYKLSSNKVQCTGTTTVQQGYKAKVKVELQHYDGGWTTISTWTNTGTSIAGIDKSPTLTDSGDYRLKLTHQALNSTGTSVVETITKYSDVVEI